MSRTINLALSVFIASSGVLLGLFLYGFIAPNNQKELTGRTQSVACLTMLLSAVVATKLELDSIREETSPDFPKLDNEECWQGCHRCKYFTPDPLLHCAVNPDGRVNGECADCSPVFLETIHTFVFVEGGKFSGLYLVRDEFPHLGKPVSINQQDKEILKKYFGISYFKDIAGKSFVSEWYSVTVALSEFLNSLKLRLR